jgi:hypothetical protein
LEEAERTTEKKAPAHGPTQYTLNKKKERLDVRMV